MRYFLDMNLPIYFCMALGHPLEQKAQHFINNKGENYFLLCDYIINNNLQKWLNRQKIVLFEFNQKIKDKNYILFSVEQSKILTGRDKILVTRLILMYEKSDYKIDFLSEINQIFTLLNARISFFIKRYIDEVVIPESEIDFNLKSCLFDFLAPNESDAKTIASAIQEHNKKALHIMTADKKDWTDDLIGRVHDYPGLSKVYPSLPKIEYLQNYIA